MPDFVHLHVHSEYSLLDGACRISKAVKAAAEMGQKALAITDHGVMYGVYDFWSAAKSAGIKPIIGCEIYLAPRDRFSKVHELDSESTHLVLLCENMTGYKNLMKIVSMAWTEGFYNKPRADMDLIKNYSEGLICLSACLAGIIPRLILSGRYDEAKSFALELANIFGENHFYLEMQDHGIPEQKLVNASIIRLHQETGIPLVATNDAHYIRKEDAMLQDVLMCIQMVKKLNDTDRMRFATEEFYLKSAEEMEKLFGIWPEALSNTVKIAEMCNVNFEFNGYIQPRFHVPEGETSDSYLRKLCEEGFVRRYGENAPREYRDRLEYELSVITRMGFSDYYLIVSDYVNYAKRTGIPVGPGRGSGAGSIAAYCMGITDLCPMKYQLYFERFLNPERVSMPDFDVDFCPKRREDMIAYMVRTYGADHVSQIVTFGTMAARAVIRDVGRVLDVPYAEVDKIAKMIPNELHINLTEALKKSASLKECYDSDPQVKRLIDIALGLEGMPRNASTHAAGIVVTPEPVVSYVPLSKNDEAIVTQFPMTTIADLGLVKMDFLGLRNLTIIDDCVKQIKKKDPEFDLSSIPDDDAATFQMLSEGKTCGVFQLESSGMTSVAVNLRAQSIEEICALIALYRPGPMEQIPKYIEGKWNPKSVTYRHPKLEEVLSLTYGVPLYQEQVMEIFRKLAGYSMGRADVVRRAISKKKTEVLKKEREIFIHGSEAEGVCGCEANGIPAEAAELIFSDIESFASYGFNKAHSAAYALVAYQTAYLKCHYPGEYMGSLLSSVLGDAAKVAVYSAECKALGIRILPPDVNYSEDGFIVEEGNIRFGLVALKNVGMGVIRDLVTERKKNGKFIDFADWCRRMSAYDFNKRAAESLIMCGACDCFGVYRSQMLAVYEQIMDSASKERAGRNEFQFCLFGEEELPVQETVFPEMKEFSRRELLAMEKATAGIYLSGHPLDDYSNEFIISECEKLAILSKSSSEDGEMDSEENGEELSLDGTYLTVGGIITSVKQKSTKSDQMMAFVGIEDDTGSTEMLVFPQSLTRFGAYLIPDNVVVIHARVSMRDGEEAKLICSEIRPARPNSECDLSKKKGIESRPNPSEPVRSKETVQTEKLWIKLPTYDEKVLKRLRGLFTMFPGNVPVILYIADTKQRLSAGDSLKVSADQRMINELYRLFGKENVVRK